ncbi:Uncharacterised protein [uncultured Clostridium sp.]|nr:Uncharacterised protein [uncultured Clostridium sp.]
MTHVFVVVVKSIKSVVENKEVINYVQWCNYSNWDN